MTADEFVAELARSAPAVEFLIRRGYGRECAEGYRKGFFLRRRGGCVERLDEPLLDLIERYDTSSLEIGVVRLGGINAHYESRPEKSLVGSIEADPLVLVSQTGEVLLLDHAQPSYVMAKCAVSGARFLDALIVVARFHPPYVEIELKHRLNRAQAEANNEAAHKAAAKCAEVAGISRGINIYHTLLACDCWVV